MAGRNGGWSQSSQAKMNLSTESDDLSIEDEIAIERLEFTKVDLQNRITKEVAENAVLQKSLERRKQLLRENRFALERDLERLCEQLQKERDERTMLDAAGNSVIGDAAVSSKLESEFDQKHLDICNFACESRGSPQQEDADQPAEVKTTAKEQCEKPPRTKNIWQSDVKSRVVPTNFFFDCIYPSTHEVSSLSDQLSNLRPCPYSTSACTEKFTNTCSEDVMMKRPPPSLKNLQQQLSCLRKSRSTTAMTSPFANGENVGAQECSDLLKEPLQIPHIDSTFSNKQTRCKSKSVGLNSSPTDSQSVVMYGPSSFSYKVSNKLQSDEEGLSGSKSTISKRCPSSMERSNIWGGAFSKKNVGKGEGSGPSKLTRLTNLLSFWKERRSEVANEIQALDTSGNALSEQS